MTAPRRFLFALLAVALAVIGGPGAAQLSERNREYYQAWLRTAERAEAVVDADRASAAALGQLRQEVAGYRDAFDDARSANSARIVTLTGQLDALGPPPEDGSAEPADIAALRVELNTQLTELRVPRIISEEAFSRASGLIREIDRIIYERRSGKLTSRGPSPLNPAHWPGAWDDIRRALNSLIDETALNFNTAADQKLIRERAPGLLFLTVVGVVLLFRGKRWSGRLADYLRSLGSAGSGVWSFIVSLARILLPWLGTVALVRALMLTGVPGVRGTLLLENVPYWAALLLYYDWIGRQLSLFRKSGDLRFIAPERLPELRVLIDLLAVSLVVFDAVLLFERIENTSPETRAVVSFPVILLAAGVLLRFQQIRNREADSFAEETGETVQRAGFSMVLHLLRRALFLLAIFSPILAAVGYFFAAEAVVFPAIKTLALIATLLVVQRFLGSLYGLVTGRSEEARDSLFTVLAGFALTILALPILAIYWGASTADLTEAWSAIVRGFDIGGITVSPRIFLLFAVIFSVGYMLTRVLQSGLRNSLLPKTSIDPGVQNAVVSGTGYVGIFLAAVVAITGAGLDLSSLAIVAGALSVGIGFGLQTIVSNFVSGIILLIERPISKGDWIDVNGQMGYVRDISVRATRIETFDRTDVIVPNSDLIAGSVVNYTRGNTVGRVIVPVGVAYGTDTRKVEEILGEIANAHPMVLANPAPNVVFQGFGADSLDFEIRAILRDVNWVLKVKSDMNHEIARRFTEEGIEIPFAQRDVWLRNPETLRSDGDEDDGGMDAGPAPQTEG